jgi:hypothetical protein
MKKQILILIVALFAISFSTVYGQAVHDPAINSIPVTCANGPLNPIAGRPYDYQAVINPVAGLSYWYATNSTTFTTGGVRVATEIPADGVKIANTAVNYRTSAVAPTSPTQTEVTWTTAGLAGVGYPAPATPLFMVVEYAGPTCANNMKVMKITPVNAFTLDITNLDHAAGTTLPYGTAESQCVDIVRSSAYDAVADNITIDYGADTLFFEVIAANFTGTYVTQFQVAGVQGTQTFDLDWGYVRGIYNQAVVAGQASGLYTSGDVTVSTTETNTQLGVSIFARVIVHNHGFETLAATPISVAVEGHDANGNFDVLPGTCAVPSPGFEDLALQTVNPRSAVTPGTPMLPQKP